MNTIHSFKKSTKFYNKNLENCKEITNFATSKLKSGTIAAGFTSGVFCATTFRKQYNGCTVSGTSNGPGALLLRLRQHVVRPFFNVLKLRVMNQTIQCGHVHPLVISKMETTIKNLREKFNRKVEESTFCQVMGITPWHLSLQGLAVTALATILIILICSMAEWLEGGAL